MDIKVTHFVDNEKHLVINASGPSFSYGAVLSPNFKDGNLILRLKILIQMVSMIVKMFRQLFFRQYLLSAENIVKYP